MAPPNKGKGGRKAPAKKKLTAADKRITVPCSATALAGYGQLKTPVPTTPFDPKGAWRQSYFIWMTGGTWQCYRGMLTFERTPKENGIVSLRVNQQFLADRMRSIHEMSATILCQDDALGTPLSWQLRSRMFDSKTGKDFANGTVEQIGKAVPEAIEITTNGVKTTHKVAGPWTSNWSLFEAVQRASGAPPRFTLLEDLDMVKPVHRLHRRGEETLTFAGKEVRATRYDQIGQGCLPRVYYVDGTGRLILTHTALRAYILDADVAETHRKKLALFAKRELK